jgi:hypothetical protein
MIKIATSELRSGHVPPGRFKWSSFSEFALTFDPLSEATDEADALTASATPTEASSTVGLRNFLYCWQRIGNNQGSLPQDAITKIRTAMKILRSRLGEKVVVKR